MWHCRLASAPLSFIAVSLMLAGPLLADARKDPGFGAPGSGPGQLDTPLGVATLGGSIYVADFHNDRVQQFTREGTFMREWGARGGGHGEFVGPMAVAVDAEGEIFVSDLYNNRIQKFSADGRFLTAWGSEGRGNGQFRGPYGVAVNGAGEVFVTDLDNHRVQKFSNDGRFLSAWGSRGSRPGQLDDPWGIAVDARGFVYVADHGNDRIQKFAADGTFLGGFGSRGTAPGRLMGPVGVTVGRDGRVYVSDLVQHRIQAFDTRGAFIGQTETSAAGNAPFNLLAGLAADPLDGSVAYSDPAHHRVGRLLDPSGQEGARLPTTFMMRAARPNPSMGLSILHFALPERGRLTVRIFGVDGRLMRVLSDAELGPGEHDLEWDGLTDIKRPVPAGIYFVRSEFDHGAGTSKSNGRIVILR